jgi:uncharacterized protein (DUF885 family)
MTRREWIALAAAAPLGAASAGIDRFFDDFLERWVRQDPELATRMRLFPSAEQERLDARLSDTGDEFIHSRIRLARETLAELGKFDRATLTPAQRISAAMLEHGLRDVIDEEPFLALRFPMNQFNGPQSRIPTLMTDLHPLRTVRDAENYLARLQAFAPKLDQSVAGMRERAGRGLLLPRFILLETAQQMQRFAAPTPASNILVTSFARRLGNIPEIAQPRRDALAKKAEGLIAESVYPAYRRAADEISTEAAKATDVAGISRLPQGADAYAFYLRRYTTTSLSPERIPQIGLDEVKRIEAEMDGLLRKLGYTGGTVNQRMDKLEEDRQYPDTPDVRQSVLADYTRIVEDARRLSLSSFLHTPKTPCIVQRIPEFQEANAAANYQAPAPDGSRPGIFRVPLPGPRFNHVRMRSLAYHEAIPGHHFQLALQVEMTSLPRFRRQYPFGPLSAYSEGWGLYAERLASDLGWYKDDAVGDLGRLASELFRARRLVVDTGIHTKGWTRQQAIDYDIQRSEVDRYTAWPGQACSYKIGQLKILELRDRAKKQLGARFDLKEFHDVVLRNGAVPLALLESIVDDWLHGRSA